MAGPPAEENLQHYLDRRERVLTEEVRSLRTQLTPKETELVLVRRAKAALGLPTAFDVLGGPPYDPGGAIDQQLSRERTLQSFADTLKNTPTSTMKIKELIARAFVDHLHQGATPAELGSTLQKEYGREIDPGSIRPNLQRLKDDGILMRDAGSRWRLDPAAASVIVPRYRSDDEWILEAARKLAWREDDSTRAEHTKGDD